MSVERGATAVRDGDGLTITLHIPAEELPMHHPSNFRNAELGLCQMGLSLCVDTGDARQILRELHRENTGIRERIALKEQAEEGLDFKHPDDPNG